MTKMKPGDPAYWMLHDGIETIPVVHNKTCYICNDSEYAQMGLPLCYECLVCSAHVPADDQECDNGHMQPSDPQEELNLRKEHGLEISDQLIAEAKDMKYHTIDDVIKDWSAQ